MTAGGFTQNLANFYGKTGGNDTWGAAASSLFDTMGENKKIAADTNVAKAYQTYLNQIAKKMAQQLAARADNYDTKLQNQFNEAEPQFQQESTTQLAELQPLIEDITNQSTEAQRQNQRQINASLAQQGVRGGQAAILANRATGELNRDLQRDINKTIYDEAANRQQSRLNYYGQKAMTPWSTMSGAYGNSMTGANNALSGAQANNYERAYNYAMNNYKNTLEQKKNKGALGSKIGGLAGGIIGSYFGPVGSAVGSAAGSYIGGKIGK